MQNENKNSLWNYLAVCSLLMILVMGLFRMNDPYLLLLPCLLIVGVCMQLKFHLSCVDLALGTIWLTDIIRWCLYPTSGIETVYNTTLCLTGYLLLRNILDDHRSMILFLKAFCFPAAASLCIALISFIIFKDALYTAGFIDTYPFRFLFHPLGHITNVWSMASLLIGGLFVIGYIKVAKWRWVFIGLWFSSSLVTLLSFSRGAYLAWGLNVIVILLAFDAWRKRLYFFILCLCIGGTVWVLFPSEFSTTCTMNKTVSQRQSTESRLNATECAMKVSLKNKWLGAGNGNYLLMVDKELNQDSTQAYTSYAPNAIVQIIVEKGWIGLTIYLFLFIAIASIVWIQRHHSVTVVIGGILLSVCVKELTMSVMLNNYLVLFLIYVVLALLQMKQDNKRKLFQGIPVKLCKYALLAGGVLCFVVFEVYTLRHLQNENYNQMSINAFNKENYQEAIRCLEQTPEQTPYLINRVMLGLSLPDSLLPNYWLCMDRSMILLKQKNKEDIYIDYLRAKLAERKEKNELACNILDTLANKFPENAVFQYELFTLLYDRGMLSKGFSHLENALLLLPNLIHKPKVKQVKNTMPHIFSKILENIISQQKKDNQSANWYARCGYLAYYIGDDKISETLLRQSVDEQPSFITPYYLLGKLCEKKKQKNEAANYFRKYNLLMNGAFSNNNGEVKPIETSIPEQKILLQRYSMKFQNWYHSNLLF